MRDYERCVRSKEVRTQELVGQTVRVRITEVLREFSNGVFQKLLGRYNDN